MADDGGVWAKVYPDAMAAIGGGKILQVVSSTTSSNTSATSDTYVDTGLSASITPSSASSKVLVLLSQQGLYVASVPNDGLNLRLYRDSTSIAQISRSAFLGKGPIWLNGVSYIYLDSPATTSEKTYKTMLSSVLATGDVRVQVNSETTSSIVLVEVAA